MKKFVHPFLYIFSLIACCIEVDISVPSFPSLVEYFYTTESLAQHTISINFLGFFIGSLIVGPLADAYGRRPVMIAGNAILMIGALNCVWASTISVLLLARLIQGFGASTSAVVVFVMIADTYKGEKATQLIGLMNCVFTCLMAISPVIGTYLNEVFGWRGNYAVVALICVISWIFLAFSLPETLKVKQSVHWGRTLSDFRCLLRNNSFLQTSLAPSLLYASYLSFITSASFLYMQTFKLSIYLYALHQAFIVAAFAIVSVFSGVILKHISSSKCILLGIGLSSLGTLAFLLVGIVSSGVLMTTITVSLFAVGAALFYPVAFSASLEIFPDIKGTATSLIMSKRAVVVALVTFITGYSYNGDPTRIALIMTILTCVAAFTAMSYYRASSKKVAHSSI